MRQSSLVVPLFGLALGLAVSHGLRQSAGSAVEAQQAPVNIQPAAQPMAAAGGGEWVATGLCGPSMVTPQMLRLVFDPNVVLAPEPGVSPLDVLEQTSAVVFGDYEVSLNPVTHSVDVTGPDGAAVLKRDIDRCIGPNDGTGFNEAGAWRWSPIPPA